MNLNLEENPSPKTFAVWFTGLSGSGKTTLSVMLTARLRDLYFLEAQQLDGDVCRKTVCADLGFSPEDREENITRVMAIAAWHVHHDTRPMICSFISPYEARRQKVKKVIPNCLMVEVRCPVEVCERRDVKGLYAKARSGEIPEFTGISAPYERVECADLIVHTNNESPERMVQQIITLLKQKGWLESV